MTALAIQSIEEIVVKLLRGTISLNKPSDTTRTQAMADILAIDPTVSLASRPREGKRTSAIVVNTLSTFEFVSINKHVDLMESLLDLEIYTVSDPSLQAKELAIRLRHLLRIVFSKLSGTYGTVRIDSLSVDGGGSDIDISPGDGSDNWTYFTTISLRIIHSVTVPDVVFPSG